MPPREMIRMPRGGPRNRSGPQPDPKSLRSAAKGFVPTALPRGGYDGDVPDFPLPEPLDRELEVWAAAWRTPQAAAWAVEAWRWHTVAMWVRWTVRMEDPHAGAGLGAVTVRLADQIGMTPAGLRENGWAVARDEVSQKRTATVAPPDGRSSARDRMTVVPGATAEG
jgi:hypothetical protein